MMLQNTKDKTSKGLKTTNQNDFSLAGTQCKYKHHAVRKDDYKKSGAPREIICTPVCMSICVELGNWFS